MFYSTDYTKLDGSRLNPSDLLEPILAALDRGNHDRSDLLTDYFDVGWYVEVNIGAWNRPFVFIGHEAEAVAA